MAVDAHDESSTVYMPPSQFPALVPELLTALRALKVTNPKATRSTVHIYPATLYAKNVATAKDRHITSWKMTEHMYFKKDNEFPTLARGLFTEPVSGKAAIPPAALPTFGSEPVKERIVARGYDKFFNTGEMAWTSVSEISVPVPRARRLGSASPGMHNLHLGARPSPNIMERWARRLSLPRCGHAQGLMHVRQQLRWRGRRSLRSCLRRVKA